MKTKITITDRSVVEYEVGEWFFVIWSMTSKFTGHDFVQDAPAETFRLPNSTIWAIHILSMISYMAIGLGTYITVVVTVPRFASSSGFVSIVAGP